MPARHGPGPDPACPLGSAEPPLPGPGRVPTLPDPACPLGQGSPPFTTPPGSGFPPAPSGVPACPRPARLDPARVVVPARRDPGPDPARPPGQGFLPVLFPPESGYLLFATPALIPVACWVRSPGSSPPLPGLGSPHSPTPPTWGVLSPGLRRLSEPCKSGVSNAVAGPPPLRPTVGPQTPRVGAFTSPRGRVPSTGEASPARSSRGHVSRPPRAVPRLPPLECELGAPGALRGPERRSLLRCGGGGQR